MCGIVGIYHGDGRPVDQDLLRRMCTMLTHRGPDEEGMHVEGPIGLGHRRLIVIDPSTGSQPMANEDGSLWLISNSEIYNYQELRTHLEKLGHRFSTQSDTEVILHLYEEKGKECVRSLQGMFAFALWDARNKRLFLARDRLGKKPLYYYEKEGFFLFASMPGPLLLHPEVHTGISASAIDMYLSLLYIPGPKTLFSKIQKLAPASVLICEQARIHKETYWNLEYGPKFAGSEEEAAEQMGEILEESVRVRLRSDVPLGAFLSGGIDSSLVAALMTKELGRAPQAFSIGFQQPGFDEIPYARRVARHLEIEHHASWIRSEDLEELPQILAFCGEPLADPSLVPTYFLSRLARGYVTVVLSGDAGDETFAGYDRYLYARLAEGVQRMAPFVVSRDHTVKAHSTLRGHDHAGISENRWRKLFRFISLPLEQGHLHQFDQMAAIDRRNLYTEEFLKALPPEGPARQYFQPLFDSVSTSEHYLDRLLSVDTRSYLPWDILVKVDTATMANSLEARSPFLDNRFVEFAARLPPSYKMHGLTRKYLLKRFACTLLPADIVHRRKRGFGIPLSLWLRGNFGRIAEEILLDPGSWTQPIFRKEALGQLFQEHRGGRKDCAYILWAILVLEYWLRAHGIGSVPLSH